MKKKLIASFGERIKSILQMSKEVTAADNQRHDDDAVMNNGYTSIYTEVQIMKGRRLQRLINSCEE